MNDLHFHEKKWHAKAWKVSPSLSRDSLAPKEEDEARRRRKRKAKDAHGASQNLYIRQLQWLSMFSKETDEKISAKRYATFGRQPTRQRILDLKRHRGGE